MYTYGMEDIIRKDLEFDANTITRIGSINRGSYSFVEKYKLNNSKNIFIAVKKISCISSCSSSGEEGNDMIVNVGYSLTKKQVIHEVEIQKSIVHENILKCFGMYFEKETNANSPLACIVLEYCSKGDLFTFLYNNSIENIDRIEILLQITYGLKHLHDNKIVHRDLKPQNLLIGNDGYIKICDFGSSKTLRSFGNTTVGSPIYISPERLTSSLCYDENGKLKRMTKMEKEEFMAKIDPRSGDIYSLSIIMYEVLSQKTPFQKLLKKCNNFYKLLFEIHGDPNEENPQPIRPDLNEIGINSKKLKDLISSCWNSNPLLRKNIDEIITVLKEVKQEISPSIKYSLIDTFERLTPIPSKIEKNFEPFISETDSFNDLIGIKTYHSDEERSFDDDDPEKISQKFISSLVLGAVGDSFGYKNGYFEYCLEGRTIIDKVRELGGIENIDLKNWNVSDDTIMALATTKALIKVQEKDIDKIMTQMAKEYVDCWIEMPGRGPGGTCRSGVIALKSLKSWNEVVYNSRGGGCGGSMRSCPVGLRFHGKQNRDMLIAIGIESGRLTHNCPTGYLGSLVSAVFTAFAMEDISPNQWGYKFLNEILPKAFDYLKKCNRDVEKIEKDSKYFIDHFTEFLNDRNINKKDCKNDVVYDKIFLDDVKVREGYWKKFSFMGFS